MNFLKQIHNPKVHPLSKKMVMETAEMLERHGVTDVTTKAKCSLALFQATIKHVKEIVSSEAKGHNTDELLKKQSDELKEIISKYGFTSEEDQETIILEYLEVVGNIGGR